MNTNNEFSFAIVDSQSLVFCSVFIFSQRLHDVVLPLCVRLQQQQSSSSTSCESAGGVSGQYCSALTRRELYRCFTSDRFTSAMFLLITFDVKHLELHFVYERCYRKLIITIIK